MIAVDLQWSERLTGKGIPVSEYVRRWMLQEGPRLVAAHQPAWCNYPEAASGPMGCWSLWYGYVTGPEYCCNCDERKLGEGKS